MGYPFWFIYIIFGGLLLTYLFDIKKDNMIKKYLLWIWIWLLTFIWFSNANNYYSPFSIVSACEYSTDNTISTNWNFTSYYNWVERDNILYFIWSNRNACTPPNVYAIGWKNGKLYWFFHTIWLNWVELNTQWYFDYVWLCSDPDDNCFLNLSFTGAVMWYLKSNSIIWFYGYNHANSSKPFPDTAYNKVMDMCFITNNSTQPYLCFFKEYLNNITNVSSWLSYVVGDWWDITSWDWFFESSPLVTSPNYTPNVQTTYTDLDRYIDYYETRYWRNINMCYVGTNDLTSPYGTTGISFEVGTWKLIYELYYSLYSGFWSNKIKNVWKFVNSWLINYSQWFYDWKHYLVTDNWPDTNITVRYENLTPPFTNQPVAIYFMASNLFDTYVRESTQWEEIVYYCDLKVNYNFYKANEDEFEDTVDQTDKNITDRVKDYFNSQIVNWSWKVGFVVPNLSWSVWGETSSWNVLPEDLNPTSLFKDFFARITTLYSNFDYSTNPILPAWIVYPLIFLVLFRIFRH